MAEKKDGWDKARIIATVFGAIGAVAISIVVAVVGSEVNTSLKERDIDVQMIELAVSILQQEPSPDTEALRDWAVRMVDKHSGEPCRLGGHPVSAHEQLTSSCRLRVRSGRPAPCPFTSAAGGKADVLAHLIECPLIATSGYWWLAFPKTRDDKIGSA